ncbi:MAG: sulfatase-like hydrolase/transferase [Oscillospiraceae bacterium]|nr:sulfatase-like hydrolase/transferase [Oscillospiraceae bacterium]
MSKPNVVFILTDDQRFDTIHALGCDQIKTPNLDRLAAEGTAFTRAHIPSGTVGAVCMPSRAMINTGRSLYHLVQDGAEIPPEHATLPETLRKNGYTTCGIGKWHNGAASYARSFCDGAEIFFGGMWDHWNVPTYHFDPTGRYDHMAKACMNPCYNNDTSPHRTDHLNQGRHSTDLFSEEAINWLEKYEGEDPFYLYLAFMAPHDPRTMPEEFQHMYDPKEIRIPPNFAGQHFDFGIYEMRDEILAPYPRREEDVRRHIADYYAMISHLDWRIGQVVETLKKKGVYENTILVFSGDNGLSIGQHGLMGKQNCYDHSLRVPLILAGPGIPRGETREGYVYLMDIFPTLCDLTGCRTPDSVDGISFAPMLGDRAFRTRESIYAGYADKIRCVKDERYKLIEYRYPRACMISEQGEGLGREGLLQELTVMTQLFDLQSDPWEVVNLAELPEHQKDVERLRGLMKQTRDSWDELENPWGKRFWDLF